MNERRAERRRLRVVAVLTILMALMAGCQSRLGTEARAIDEGAARLASSPRSPKELALADFLSRLNLSGKPVLIEFGLVGCVLSEEGLHNMIALQTADTVPGLAFVRVEANPDEAVVAQYFKDKAPAFPVYRDSGSALAKSLSATAFPTFVLVDKFGHIRYQGSYPKDNVVQWAKSLAAETQDPGGNVAQLGARKINAEELLAAKLPDLKDQLRPLSQYKGRGGLVLLFVDTSCPFSATALRETPMVAKSLTEYGVNAVVLNNGDPQDKVRAFYSVNDSGAPVVYDVGSATREQWNVHSVPIAIYISPAGQVGYQGEAVWADMGAAIEKSLGLASGAIKFTAAGTGFG